ncbi:MAG TPA: hypothetical protein VHY77_10675 [Acidimicrobiales bacterium]|jgi:hypothetical protein|nr:hypothetical protein [Acidimicrobiales bacterium]
MFARFSLPDVPAVSRRTVTAALIVGVMALAAAISFDHYLLGVGACIGLALGTINFRMVGSSVVKVGAREDENKRRPLALNTMARMGIISVITIGLLFVSFNLGFGVLAGLAVFQLLLLVNVARSMFKLGPPTDSGEGVLDADVLDVVERSDDTRGGA